MAEAGQGHAQVGAGGGFAHPTFSGGNNDRTAHVLLILPAWLNDGGSIEWINLKNRLKTGLAYRLSTLAPSVVARKACGSGDADAVVDDVGDFGFGLALALGNSGHAIGDAQLGGFELKGEDQAAFVAGGSGVGDAAQAAPDEDVAVGDDGAAGVDVTEDDHGAGVADFGSGADGGLEVEGFGEGGGGVVGGGGEELLDAGLLFDAVACCCCCDGGLTAAGVDADQFEVVGGEVFFDFLELADVE